MRRLAADVKAAAGPDGVDVLVNNAGSVSSMASNSWLLGHRHWRCWWRHGKHVITDTSSVYPCCGAALPCGSASLANSGGVLTLRTCAPLRRHLRGAQAAVSGRLRDDLGSECAGAFPPDVPAAQVGASPSCCSLFDKHRPTDRRVPCPGCGALCRCVFLNCVSQLSLC